MERKDEKHHVVSPWVYLVVLISLLFLTALTVWASNLDLGRDLWNNVVALTIATTKALLVIAFFMHLKYDSKINAVYVLLAVLLLVLLISLSLLDTLGRPEYFPSKPF